MVASLTFSPTFSLTPSHPLWVRQTCRMVSFYVFCHGKGQADPGTDGDKRSPVPILKILTPNQNAAKVFSFPADTERAAGVTDRHK